MGRRARRLRFPRARVLALSTLALALLAGSSRAATYSFIPIDVPGAVLTAAFGINKAGRIVGGWLDADTEHGFLRKRDGSVVTLDVPGAFATEPHGINNAGTIVGVYVDAGGAAHGFLAVPQ